MIETGSLVAGIRRSDGPKLEVRSPFSGELVGTVVQVGSQQIDEAIDAAVAYKVELTRYERFEILSKSRERLLADREGAARIMSSESGLCLRDTLYEVGRVADVLHFAAIEALRDDGQIMNGDVSGQGKVRKIFTVREPLQLVAAITPFNHPMNQVAHKVAPAIAVGAPMILKPSEKTPLSALYLADLLIACGLPGPMLSIVLGPTDEVAEKLVVDPRTELITFTGSVAVGKRIAATAGYKKIALELGGNDPLIVLADADLDLAAHLAAEGSYRNSGQRCTAVKRILVVESVHDAFVEKLVAKTAEYSCGDPLDPETKVGTVIDVQSAERLEKVVQDAEASGAQVLAGGNRDGALMQPTVIVDVPRTAEMICQESFGPLAPVIKVRDLDDAIKVANSTAYGLSSGVVTNDLSAVTRCVKELRVGTINVNEVPGYRIESSPFGGVKDSGFGIKEGVVEAMKFMSNVKTFSIPW